MQFYLANEDQTQHLATTGQVLPVEGSEPQLFDNADAAYHHPASNQGLLVQAIEG